jgi:hypothetical protein
VRAASHEAAPPSASPWSAPLRNSPCFAVCSCLTESWTGWRSRHPADKNKETYPCSSATSQSAHSHGHGTRRAHRRNTIAIAVATLAVAACGGFGTNGSGGNAGPNVKPAFISGPVGVKSYDGNTDDLLTAGLGKDGLAAAAPAFANPNAPTAVELRRNAIWANYRAIVDVQAAGGYGSLYGPNVDAKGM